MKIRTLAFAAASALAAAAWAKAPLVPLYCYRFTDYDAAAGGFSRPARNYGTGEIPLCGPHPAIINAIYNACGARVTHLPAYPEKVLAVMPKK